MNSAPAHSSPTSGSLRFRQLRTRLTVAGILTLVVFCAATAYDSSRSYRYTLTATNRELINVANALAEQTASTLKTVDLLLQDTARWYRYDLSEIPPGQLDRVLANRTAGVRQVSLVTIVDAQGSSSTARSEPRLQASMYRIDRISSPSATARHTARSSASRCSPARRIEPA